MPEEHPNLPAVEQQLRELAENTARTLRIHTDMLMSIDTKLEMTAQNLQELTASQAGSNARMDRLRAIVDTNAATVSTLAEAVLALTGVI